MTSAGDSRAFWGSRRVLVTGGAGFLGSHVIQKLEEHEPASIFIPRKAEYNLIEREAVQQVLADSEPDIVLHLAARAGGIGANQARPAEFFYDNLMMGTQLLHESWRAGVEKFVAIGTVCSYPKFTPVPFREEHIWDGYPEETNAPYGVAKKMLIVQSEAYREQYGFNSINLIPVNLYGPRDNFDLQTSHVIPALIRKIIAAIDEQRQQVVLWGDGTPTREFLYAPDAAQGILMGAEQVNFSDPINLGSDSEISIRDLAELIGELTGYEGEFVWDTSKPNGQPRRALDTSRAREEFGFQAETSLREGLRKTIDWYRQHRDEVEGMVPAG